MILDRPAGRSLAPLLPLLAFLVAFVAASPVRADVALSLADRVALRAEIVNLLASSNEPVSLCNLIESLDLAQATISEHLKRLVEAGLLVREERGKWSYFSLDTEAFERVAALAELPQEVCC